MGEREGEKLPTMEGEASNDFATLRMLNDERSRKVGLTIAGSISRGSMRISTTA